MSVANFKERQPGNWQGKWLIMADLTTSWQLLPHWLYCADSQRRRRSGFLAKFHQNGISAHDHDNRWWNLVSTAARNPFWYFLSHPHSNKQQLQDAAMNWHDSTTMRKSEGKRNHNICKAIILTWRKLQDLMDDFAEIISLRPGFWGSCGFSCPASLFKMTMLSRCVECDTLFCMVSLLMW